MNLHNLMRPRNLAEVTGHPNEVAILRGWITQKQIPQCVLFLGNTGTGKTSLATLLARNVNREHPKTLPIEYNCADNRGLDLIRECIEPQLLYAPMDGSSRVFILDELCQLPKTTQQAMLTLLEKPPKWAYFFGCSTPSKFERAFLGRFKQVSLDSLSVTSLNQIITSICERLNKPLNASVISQIAARSEGSARAAISMLELVFAIGPDTNKQLACLPNSTDELETGATIDLCRLIFSNKHHDKEKWKLAAGILKTITEPHETSRRIILAYANKCMLNGMQFARYVIHKFEYSFEQSGDAGFNSAVFDVIHKK